MRVSPARSARLKSDVVRPRLGIVCLLALAATSAVAVAHQAGESRRPPIQPVPGLESFQRWASQVRRHVPGTWDDAARTIAALRIDDLQNIRTDLGAFAFLFAQHSTSTDVAAFGTLAPSKKGSRQATIEGQPLVRLPEGGQPFLRPFKLRDIPALLNLSHAEFSKDPDDLDNSADFADFAPALRELEPAVTRFMEEAAMLHADIAALAPAAAAAQAAQPSRARVPGTVGAVISPRPTRQDSPVAMHLLDGQVTGYDVEPVHYEIARAALDSIRPNEASADDARRFVQLWYRATSAQLLSGRAYGYAEPNLDHARHKLTDDAEIQLYSGVVQENQAAPAVQAALASVGKNVRATVAPPRESLEHAEAYFERALALEPTLTVASIHHARIVGLLGRHEAAADELRRAVASVDDPVLAYYGELFLGGEEQALGHVPAARAAFEQASVQFPRAQSPYLSLSQLAWQNADRVSALQAVGELTKLPGVTSDRIDPWWVYDISTVFDKGALATALLAAATSIRGQ